MKIKLFALGLIVLFLTACQQPTVFDVPLSAWNQMSPEQQAAVIEGYNQRKMVEAQNRTIQDAINTAGTVLQHQSY